VLNQWLQHFVIAQSRRLENIVTYPPLATICHLTGGQRGCMLVDRYTTRFNNDLCVCLSVCPSVCTCRCVTLCVSVSVLHCGRLHRLSSVCDSFRPMSHFDGFDARLYGVAHENRRCDSGLSDDDSQPLASKDVASHHLTLSGLISSELDGMRSDPVGHGCDQNRLIAPRHKGSHWIHCHCRL